MKQGGLILATDRVRSKEKKKKRTKKKVKSMKKSAASNTPRNPQQPGDRDHLETALDETRPTR